MHCSDGLDMPGVSDLASASEREVTREQGPIRAFVSFTLQRNMCAEHEFSAIR